MPYTKKDRRMSMNQDVAHINLETKGDLTAAIFQLQLMFIDGHELNYQNISDAIAAANDSNDEIKKRIRDLYEDKCIIANGDFYLVDKIIDRTDKKFFQGGDSNE